MADLPDVSHWSTALLDALIGITKPRHWLYPGATLIYAAAVLELLNRGWRLQEPSKPRLVLAPDKPGPHF